MIRFESRAARLLRGRATFGLWNAIETRKALLIWCGESKNSPHERSSRILRPVVQPEPPGSPGHLVKEASQRLSFTAALVALVYSTYEVLYFTVWSAGAPAIARVIGMIAIAMSLAVSLGIRACPARF